MGIDSGYINSKSINAVGLSAFLEDLSFMSFVDSRPDSVKEKHRSDLAREVYPKWKYQLERSEVRCLTLTEETDANYIEIAVQVGILIDRKIANPGRAVKSIESIVSQVIEAIGIGWITTDTLPSSVRRNDDTSRRVSTVPRTQGSKSKSAPHSDLAQESPYGVYIRRSVGRVRTNSRKRTSLPKE